MASTASWGMTAAEGRAALKASHGKQVMVRTHSVDASKHAGRAKLIEVLSDTKALIQPLQGHKKNEQVLLTSLKLWHSANVAQGIQIPMTPIAEPIAPAPIKIERFYLISRNLKSIFGGKDVGFTRNVHKAALYDKAGSGRAVVKVRVRPGAQDAEPILREEGLKLMGEWHGAPPGVPFLPPQEHIAPLSLPQPHGELPTIECDIDIDAILRDDGKELEQARNAQRKAAQDVRDAQGLLADAMRTLRSAHERVRDMVSQMVPQTLPPSTTRRIRHKPGSIRKAIMAVLMESSRLSQQSICDKAKGKMGVDAPSDDKPIMQCLYHMRTSKLADRDDNMNWSLTVEGRQLASKKD